MGNPIKELRKTRWWELTVRRHRIHLAMCRALRCPSLITPFHIFALEVLNTPEQSRDSMLAIESPERYEPFMNYSVYIAPISAERA